MKEHRIEIILFKTLNTPHIFTTAIIYHSLDTDKAGLAVSDIRKPVFFPSD